MVLRNVRLYLKYRALQPAREKKRKRNFGGEKEVNQKMD
jgi:hypothetical protein